ncbi:MAG: TlpA family protein disulfide reductase [Oscillospiraceae bacterium]|nr:TlpA family protein disulfide reductase [Oscillospiraceae bacterium]
MKLHHSFKLFCLILVLALLVSGCRSNAQKPDATAAPANDASAAPAAGTTAAPAETTAEAAPEQTGFAFSTTDRDGNAWDQTAFADNRVVMVNFFEPWCGPCVSEMPELERLYQDYKDKGVLLIGVYATEEGVEDVLAQTGVTYPILHYTEAFDVFQTGYVPTTVFFNSTGEIVGDTEIGAHSYDEWAAILDGLL